MILRVTPGPDPPCPQPQEHGADQLPEAGRVHRVLLALAAVLQIMIIQRGPRKRHALGENDQISIKHPITKVYLCRLIVSDEPLDGCGADPGGVTQTVLGAHLPLSWHSPRYPRVPRLLPGPGRRHRGNQRGAGAVRRGLDQEGGAAIADQLGLTSRGPNIGQA